MTAHHCNRAIRWLAVCTGLAATAGIRPTPANGAWPVVEDGTARAVIVRNTEGGRVVSLAATELRDHIQSITGVRLPVVTADRWDRDAAHGALILGQGSLLEELGVDLGELPSEGFRILPVPGRPILILAGRDRGNPLGTAAPHNLAQEFGTLYAAYDLLEHWGVRWLFPGERGTVLPEQTSLFAPLLDTVQGPDFSMRNLWLTATSPDGSAASLGDEDPEKQSLAVAARLWSLRNRAGNATDAYHTRHHSPNWWTLWSDTNPEYLGLFRGQRGWRRNPPGASPDRLLARSKLCVSNPRVADAVAEMARSAFHASDRRSSYSICEQDGSGGFCTCAACLALDVTAEGELPYGSDARGVYGLRTNLTDRYVVFWNRVAERIAGEFPDRYLGIYLYSVASDLPRRETHLSPRLRAIYVNNGQVEPNELKRRLEGWSRLNPHPIGLYIPPMFGAWPLRDFAQVTLPVFTLENVREGLVFCRDLQITGFRGNPNFRADNTGSHGVMAYAFARWLWNTDRGAGEVVEDFARHAFGPAAEPMTAYFRDIEERQAGHPRDGVLHESAGGDAWLAHHLAVFTPAFVAHLEERLAEATARADTDARRDRVELFRQNLRFTHAQLELERAWSRFTSDGSGLDEVRERYRACETLYVELWPENRPVRPLFRRGDAARAVALSGHFSVMQVLDSSAWEMRADPYGEGLEQRWFEPGSAGDWRVTGLTGHDTHLQGSDLPVWLRIRFEVPAGLDPATFRIGFRANNTSCDLFLNGRPLGQQVLDETAYVEAELDGDGNLVSGQAIGANTPFVYDASGPVRPGRSNELVIRAWGYTDRGVTYENGWLLQTR